jgi:exonuclease III
MTQKPHLKIVHWNCFKLCTDRLAGLALLLDEIQPSIVLLNEIKMNSEQANLFLRYKSYYTYHKCRNEFGGGVAILIKEGIDHSEINLESLNLEVIGLKIYLDESEFNLVSYYNPPKSALSSDLFVKMFELNSNFIVAGDLNAKSLSIGCKAPNNNGRILENLLSSTDLVVLNDDTPTHKRFGTEELDILDLFISTNNMLRYFKNFTVLQDHCMGSDHFPIVSEFSVNCKSNLNLNRNERVIRPNFTKADWIKFTNYLNEKASKYENLKIDSIDDLSLLNREFTSDTLMAAEVAIPKYIDFNANSYPDFIINLIDERKELKKIKNKTAEIKHKITRLTNRIKFETVKYNESKWNNFLGTLGPFPTSTRKFWYIINKARTCKKSGQMPRIALDGVFYNTDSEKANLFAGVLKDIFQEEPDSSESRSKHRLLVEKTIKKFESSSREFDPVVVKELDSAISKLKNTSAPGHDNIHNQHIKHLPNSFKLILLKLVNASIKFGMIKEWKIANITMIPKKGKMSEVPSEYRPISLLSVLGKLVERIIRDRLYAILEEKNLLSKYQSGFRSKRSATDNLFYFTQRISECLARGKKVCGIFFDISKAFDKVWHNGLVFKLIKLGIPNYLIAFVISFLKDRQFCVKVNNSFSVLYDIFCSVPQGSVLGPILFSIFINDIPLSNIPSFSNSVLFADDLGSLFYFNKDKKKVTDQINRYLKELENWLKIWRLNMNVNKCCYLIFGNSGFKRFNMEIKMNGEKIPYSKNPIFLGVTFDEQLCFNKHMEILRSRALKRLNIIKIFSHKSWKLNHCTLKLIYRALVGSIYDYSFFIIQRASTTNLESLQRVQNRAIRSIYNLPWDSPTALLFPISNLVGIEARFLQLGCRYISKCLVWNPLIRELVWNYGMTRSSLARSRNVVSPLCQLLNLMCLTAAIMIWLSFYMILISLT